MRQCLLTKYYEKAPMRGQRDGGNKLSLAGRPGTDGNSRSNMFGRERMSLYDIQVGLAGRPGTDSNSRSNMFDRERMSL